MRHQSIGALGRSLAALLTAAFLMLWCGGMEARPAAADPVPLDISIVAGYDGKAHPGRWVPVRFTLTNPGDDVRGELAVQVTTAASAKADLYKVPVELPKNSVKTVWIAIPGGELGAGNNRVYFYKDSARSGEKIPFRQGDVYLTTSALPKQTLSVGVVSRDPDTLNFLTLLNQRGYEVRVLPLDADEMPENPQFLDQLDVLVLNDVAADQWNERQTAAITLWTERGGSLILAGGAAYPRTAGPFAAIAPVSYRGTESVGDLGALGELAGRGLDLSQPFTVSRAEAQSGDVIAASGGLPLIVRKAYGSGEVMYVAYDLALEPVASWSGNPALWERILENKLKPAQAGTMPNIYEIGRALEFFPELKAPPFSVLMVTLICYIVLVAPIVYLVLKRLDRREWAWIVVPVISILCSAGIYGIGASGRGATLTQSLNTIEINESGSGVMSSAVGIFVPRGGDYELNWGARAAMMPVSGEQYVNRGKPMTGAVGKIIHAQWDAPSMTFLKVPYWSLAKALVQESAPRDTGRFEYTYRLTPTGIQGEITNRTNDDLTDVYLLIYQQAIAVGDLKVGESKHFQAVRGSTGWLYPADLAELIFPYRGLQDEMSRHRALLADYLQKRSAEGKMFEPLLIGWSRNPRADYTVNGKKVASEQINLWVQPLKVQFVMGNQVYIPPYAVRPTFVAGTDAADPRWEKYAGNPWVFPVNEGEYVFEYRLPAIAGAQYDKISIASVGLDRSIQLSIWNGASGTWEPLPSGQTQLEGKQAQDHLVAGSIVRMRAVSVRYGELRFPELAVEGTVP